MVQFQSTLPRRERLDGALYCGTAIEISIHAPAKGATAGSEIILPRIKEFQSTLPRRERRSCRSARCAGSTFQSTLPRRERPCRLSDPLEHHTISIHAPAKGATHISRPYILAIQFQSTLPRRERHTRIMEYGGICKFQSTLPRRERPKGVVRNVKVRYFNPRSREGSDVHGADAACEIVISIHAPAKGATHCGDYLVMLEDISIHAPAKGATRVSDVLGIRCGISIHAPAKGATQG